MFLFYYFVVLSSLIHKFKPPSPITFKVLKLPEVNIHLWSLPSILEGLLEAKLSNPPIQFSKTVPSFISPIEAKLFSLPVQFLKCPPSILFSPPKLQLPPVQFSKVP